MRRKTAFLFVAVASASVFGAASCAGGAEQQGQQGLQNLEERVEELEEDVANLNVVVGTEEVEERVAEQKQEERAEEQKQEKTQP